MVTSVLLLTVLAVYTAAQSADYCSPSLCSNESHIGCKNNGNFSSSCANDRKLVDIKQFIDLIVSKHNEYRNTVAAGALPRFEPAVRMGTMLWDTELAYLAELNVKQCAMEHDRCRNTDTFKWAGQNLAWYWSRPAATPRTAIETGITNWFNENKDATMAQINSYHSTGPVIGHFTPMVNDRNIRLGCALLQQSKSGGTEQFFACNYAQTNVLNRKVYTSGPTASKCAATNAKYPALCSEKEEIDPNVV